jgi:hypothetical protein
VVFVTASQSVVQVGTVFILFYLHIVNDITVIFNDKLILMNRSHQRIVVLSVRNKPYDDCKCLCIYFHVLGMGANSFLKKLNSPCTLSGTTGIIRRIEKNSWNEHKLLLRINKFGRRSFAGKELHQVGLKIGNCESR